MKCPTCGAPAEKITESDDPVIMVKDLWRYVPVRDPAPPDAIRRVLERFERTDCDDQSGGYESSCDECDGKGEAGRAETIAHKPNCVIGGLRGVRDPAPPDPWKRAALKCVVPMEALHADNLAGSQLIAPSLREHIADAVVALREAASSSGVRDPSPPEPTDREIGLRSALNAALVDLRIFRGVDDHFVQALEKLVEQTGVRGAGVVPPEAHP